MAQSARIERAGTDRAEASDARRRHAIDVRRLAMFQDRYGVGSFERLRAWLQQPCMTFAAIAERFGVTRERVRQWHQELLPDAPSGLERRRQCGWRRHKMRLLEDPLFRAFYRDARRHAPAARIEPIRSTTGYRTRIVRLDDRLVAIRDASPTSSPIAPMPVDRLAGYRGRAEFIYFRLAVREFLMVPASVLPLHGTSGNAHRYQQFRNTFDALYADASRPARETDARLAPSEER